MRVVPRRRAAHGANPGASIEFRATDATANVYVALAAIVRAGLAGLRAGLPPPANVEVDPHVLSGAERARASAPCPPPSTRP